MATFSVHASWFSESDLSGEAVTKVSQSFRPGDESLCAWVDEREPRRFIVSYDVETADRITAARDCLSEVVQVRHIEPSVGTLEEVGATDDDGYLKVQAKDFDELRSRSG